MDEHGNIIIYKDKIFWRKILDIYATSVDYDPKSKLTQEFFKTVQNKMHWAVHCFNVFRLCRITSD